MGQDLSPTFVLLFTVRLFDFEKSEEFKAYLRNVEAPPGDKGMLKVKAKWYKRVKVQSEQLCILQ